MGVLLTPADSAGESMYNPYLAEVVDELVAAGIAVESDGALCVFFDDITGPDGDPVPLIVRKNDGGYGYAATDLATVRYRVRELKADRILYVVDARQALHFRMVFATARRAGWLTDEVEAVQVPFGTVLGPDGKPYQSRAGDTVPLTDLLDAAVAAARAVAGTADPEATGIAAVKYADLSNNRTKDYVFDAERMVAFTGDTGVYVQYAHVRARSILDRVGPVGPVDPSLPPHPAERALALALDGYPDAVAEAGDTLEPHRLCGYLYALARAYTSFFEACPVLRAQTPRQQANRVALCRLTADTLAAGLGLLGIAAPARM
jgi:arginyl-tRNA synthetase